MKWILVILTIGGGHDTPYRTPEACQHALRHVRVSPVRKAYCMSVEQDVVFFMRDGKHIAEIR